MRARDIEIYSELGRYTPAMVNACVQRGVRFLDKRCPDWPFLINLTLLDLRDPDICMLGQTANCIVGSSEGWLIESGYTRVLRQEADSPFSLTGNAWAIYHGFNIRWPAHNDSSARWEMLRIAWSQVIKERLQNVR